MDYRINAAGLLSFLFIAYQPAGLAADNGSQQETAPDLPSLEFLEFLGSYETDEGIWIDPADLMLPEFETLLESLQDMPAGTTDDNDENGQEQNNSGNTDGV